MAARVREIGIGKFAILARRPVFFGPRPLTGDTKHVYTTGHQGENRCAHNQDWAVTEPKRDYDDDPKPSNGKARAKGRRRDLQFQLYRETVIRASQVRMMVTRINHGPVVLVACCPTPSAKRKLKLRLTRLLGWRGGFEGKLISPKLLRSGKAWPHECHAPGVSERDVGDYGFLPELSRRAAPGAGVGEVAGRVPLRCGLLEESTCRCRQTHRTSAERA